jgi:hypothetical protein
MRFVQVQFVQFLFVRVESFNSCPLMVRTVRTAVTLHSCTAVQAEYLCIEGEGYFFEVLLCEGGGCFWNS